jgi:hypothetical protein
MSQKAPNDRINRFSSDSGNTKNRKVREGPQVYVIAEGSRFKKPDMETYFAEYKESMKSTKGCSCDAVATVCTCNKVCTCNPQRRCSCVGHRSRSSTWCSCDKVCTCVPVH